VSRLTALTRIWLTRSIRPFSFTSDYDQALSYDDAANLGLYVHVPFCRTICTFCPYCKVPYEEKAATAFVDALKQEIRLVGSMQGQRADQNQQAGVTRISIGIQSFELGNLELLGRGQCDFDQIFSAIREVPFETVAMDFIFALPGQTFDSLRRDIDTAFANGANHIAVYPFIDFTYTSRGFNKMPEAEKRRLLGQITEYCLSQGYLRDSIWTFAKPGTRKYSSMTRDFKTIFGKELDHCYGFELSLMRLLGMAQKDADGVHSMTAKGAYYYHYHENHYTLSYINQMWDLMRREAFPDALVIR
jgi:oxygen-independent coproporphyrinogen-3 oxidase